MKPPAVAMPVEGHSTTLNAPLLAEPVEAGTGEGGISKLGDNREYDMKKRYRNIAGYS